MQDYFLFYRAILTFMNKHAYLNINFTNINTRSLWLSLLRFVKLYKECINHFSIVKSPFAEHLSYYFEVKYLIVFSQPYFWVHFLLFNWLAIHYWPKLYNLLASVVIKNCNDKYCTTFALSIDFIEFLHEALK